MDCLHKLLNYLKTISYHSFDLLSPVYNVFNTIKEITSSYRISHHIHAHKNNKLEGIIVIALLCIIYSISVVQQIIIDYLTIRWWHSQIPTLGVNKGMSWLVDLEPWHWNFLVVSRLKMC